jgi:hypothetical protein
MIEQFAASGPASKPAFGRLRPLGDVTYADVIRCRNHSRDAGRSCLRSRTSKVRFRCAHSSVWRHRGVCTMSPALEERLIFIPLVTAIFALLSFGFMFFVGGGTRRVRILGSCATLFIAGTGYCMSWRKELASLFGWPDAWIGAAILVAAASIALARILLSRHSKQVHSEHAN